MYHGDFYMGWERDTLQRVVDECHCNPYGDYTCCVQQGIMTRTTTTCTITSQINETGAFTAGWSIYRSLTCPVCLIVTGKLPKLPGNNPVRLNGELPQPDPSPPNLLCDVQVIEQPISKREENPLKARDNHRFIKRYTGADF